MTTPPAFVLVLAKAPVPGRVKTRLCPPATPVQAAQLAAAALRDTLDAVAGSALDGEPVIALDGRLVGATCGPEIAAALAGPVTRWHRIPQRGNGFADRLVNAHCDAGRARPGRPVLQIAMDTPQVAPGHLHDAAARLARPRCDAVLGPASDGGWWLLGLRDPRAARVLATVKMSTPETGAHTLAALRDSGLRVDALPTLTDVDTWSDAVQVAGEAPRSRFAAAVRSVTGVSDRCTGLSRTAVNS